MIDKRSLGVTAVFLIAASIACGEAGRGPQPVESEVTRPAAGGASQQPKPTREAPTARPAPTDRPTRTPQPNNTPAPEATATEGATETVFEAKGGGSDSLRTAWDQAYDLPPGVPFAVTTTEAEIQAMIDEKMAAGGYGDKISNLHVTLDNGQIIVGYTMTVSTTVGQKTIDITADGSVVFSASVDSSGNLALAVVSADFGQISVPPEMLEPMSQAISEALTGKTTGSDANVTLTSITIDDHLMTVRGYVTK